MEELSEGMLRALCPAAFYRPNKAASESFILRNGGSLGTRSQGDEPFFRSTARRRIAIGGNRAGKTTKLILECGSFCVGMRPWIPPSSKYHNLGLKTERLPNGETHTLPVRVRYVVPNFGVHLPEVVKEFRKWWPQDWWEVSSRDERGTPREFTFFNGSWMGFMSHRMQKEDFEGIEADLIAWDEPPPRDVWVALERGIVSTGGRSIVGATVLNASGWFWNEILNPSLSGTLNADISITFHSIWDNSSENNGCLGSQDCRKDHLHRDQTCANIRSWLDSIPDPDERLAREHGTPMHFGGLVLSQLQPRHIVRPFEIPRDAYIVGAIDPAGSRPFAGLHIAFIERDGDWKGIVFDETYIHQTHNDLSAFARLWREKELGHTIPRHPTASALILIDPLAEETQKADEFGRSMCRILSEEYGIDAHKVNRQGKRARLLSLNAAIRNDHYLFFDTLPRFHQERKRWSWDPNSAKLTSGPDDLCDCLQYIHSINPGATLISQAEGETRGGIWVPEQYRDRQNAIMERNKAEKAKWLKEKARKEQGYNDAR